MNSESARTEYSLAQMCLSTLTFAEHLIFQMRNMPAIMNYVALSKGAQSMAKKQIITFFLWYGCLWNSLKLLREIGYLVAEGMRWHLQFSTFAV